MAQAVQQGFANYINFSGRSDRSEFWYWLLATFLFMAGGIAFDTAVFQVPDGVRGPASAIVSIVIALPTLSVSFRRLHDVGRSAWWILLASTGLGLPIVLYWMAMPSSSSSKYSG